MPQSHRNSDLCFRNIMLTEDVGIVVLRHLASTQERVRVCRSVSKECREVVDAGVESLQVSLQCISDPSHHLPLRFPKLNKLAFNRAGGSVNEMFASLVQQQPHLLQKLQVLDLTNCTGLDADTLEQLVKLCGRLQQITLPQLARGWGGSEHDLLEPLGRYCPQLTCLKGAGDYATPESISNIAALSNLRSLDLHPEAVNPLRTSTALQCLSSLVHLQHLQLGNHLASYETCATVAACFPELTSLQFGYVGECEVSARDFMPLMACKKLQQLGLCSVSCSDELLAVLARCKVSSLTLHEGSFTATAKGASLMQQQLTHLQLKVNDRDIPTFAAALPQLRGLQGLSVAVHRASEDCSKLMRAVFSLPCLRQLVIESHYNGIRDDELDNLPNMQHLTSVCLTNHFTDASLCKVLSSTPNLQQLQLVSCGAIGDVGLACCMGHCKWLRSVKLELMRGVGASGVAAVAAGPHVRLVVLEGCRNVLADECKEVMRLINKLDLEVIKLK